MGICGIPDKQYRDAGKQRHPPNEDESIAILKCIDKLFTKGRCEGVYTESEVQARIICTSPLYAVPKKGDPYGRTIFDASSKKLTNFNGINRFIPDSMVKIVLPSLRFIRDQITSLNSAFMFTIDVKAAFMNIPVHPQD